jgi:hypothetical protein
MNKLDKQININKEPVIYNSLTAAYRAIGHQFNSNYCCRVRRINYGIGAGSKLNNKYYIDVFKRDSNQLIGYLGEYDG